MVEILGDFDDNLPQAQEYLRIQFLPSSYSLKQRWRNNGLSADFMADYLTTFFPNTESDLTKVDRQAEIKSTIGFIANELLENAMKFSEESVSYPISITLYLLESKLVFVATNSMDDRRAKMLRAFIEKLLSCDPTVMYIEQVEKSALAENEANSGLGILTAISDYSAKIGWKIETVRQNPQILTVTTMVQLAVGV